MNSNPSAPAPQIVVNSVVRVLYGPNANQYATVAGIGACGHTAHDLIAVDLHSSLHERVVFLPRFALELVPPRPVRPAGIQRICRFKVGDKVRTRRGDGRVVDVYNDPVLPDHTGRADGIFYARYKVSTIVLSRPFRDVHSIDTRYDWELQPVSETKEAS